MQKGGESRNVKRPQRQKPPGQELRMKPQPASDKSGKGSGKLQNKIALITGGDSGIGKAVAILFAKEGADVAVSYLNEHRDANDTRKVIEEYGRRCLLLSGDIRRERHCNAIVNKTIKEFGRIDILVNNAATQIEAETLGKIKTKDLIKTFETNIFSPLQLNFYKKYFHTPLDNALPGKLDSKEARFFADSVFQ